MKSFQYTAKDNRGEEVKGIIESSHFEDATQRIRSRGFELISLEELEQQIIRDLRPFVFEALDQYGEPVQGTIQGADSESVSNMLLEEFGLRIMSIHEKEKMKHSSQAEVIHVLVQDADAEEPEKKEVTESSLVPNQHAEDVEKKEEPILFRSRPSVIAEKPKVSDDQLDNLEEEIQFLLSEKETRLSESIRDRLLHLAGKIDLLRESRDKKRLRNLKRELRRVKKLAERELKDQQQEKWEEYERHSPEKGIESYTEFEDEKPKKKIKSSKLSKWMQIIDLPNENDEKEVLIKQQYESIWTEAQRFTTVLFGFYLLTLFIAYYLKRSGVEDHFLVRIYDTTVFKQLIVVLFTLFVVLTLRLSYLPKRLKSDATITIIWLLSVWWVFW